MGCSGPSKDYLPRRYVAVTYGSGAVEGRAVVCAITRWPHVRALTVDTFLIAEASIPWLWKRRSRFPTRFTEAGELELRLTGAAVPKGHGSSSVM